MACFVPVTCLRAFIGVAVAVAMIGLAPARAIAAVEPAPPPAVDDDLAEAQKLYHEGRAAYETFNYDAAISLWTTALARLPDTSEASSVRNALVYNLASAQLKAYALDHDELRLKRARLLLETYLAREREAGAADPADVERVEAQMAAIDEQLAKDDAPPPEPVAPTVVPPPPDEKPFAPSKRGTVMIGFGAALLVVGAGLTGGIASGIVISRRQEARLGELDTIEQEAERPDVVDRGKLGNRLAIATGVAAGLALAGGIALVVVGKRIRDRDKAEVHAGSRSIARPIRVGPTLAPGFLGLSAQVRL